jgi:drug/metabolite transporter (DMT)-like permease
MLLTCLIWGVNFSVMKFAMQSLPPFALNAIRFTVASATLWLVAAALEPGTPLPWRVRARLAGLGVLGNTLYQIGFILGLARTTAGNSSLLVASTPLMTAVFGSALGVERLTPAVAGAIGVGTVGVALVVFAKEVTFSLATMSGDLLTLAAVACWAIFTHGVRSVSRLASPLRVAAWTTIGGTPLLVLIGIPDLVRLDWGAVSPLTWGAVLYASFLSIVVAYLIWNRSVYRIGGNRTALLGVTVPVFALATAAIVLGERPTMVQLAGAGLILGSVVLNIVAHARATLSGPGRAGPVG